MHRQRGLLGIVHLELNLVMTWVGSSPSVLGGVWLLSQLPPRLVMRSYQTYVEHLRSPRPLPAAAERVREMGVLIASVVALQGPVIALKRA